MINILQFQEDLRNGGGLDETLKKHGLNLESAMKLCPQPQVKCVNGTYSTGEQKVKYIIEHYGKFVIRRHINRRFIQFGTYNSLSDAVQILDCLDKYGWKQENIPRYVELTGVKI